MRDPTEILIKLGVNFSEKKDWKACSCSWVAIMNRRIKLFWEKQGKRNLFPVIFPSEISLITCYSHWPSAVLSNLQNELSLCMNLVMWHWVWAVSGNWWTCSQTGQRTLVFWCSLSFHETLTESSFLLISMKLFRSYLLWMKPANWFKTYYKNLLWVDVQKV